MTGRAIVILAVAATAFLAMGAWLLDATTAWAAGLAILSLAIGMALAAAAVASAWRTPPARSVDADAPVAPRVVR